MPRITDPIRERAIVWAVAVCDNQGTKAKLVIGVLGGIAEWTVRVLKIGSNASYVESGVPKGLFQQISVLLGGKEATCVCFVFSAHKGCLSTRYSGDVGGGRFVVRQES